MFDIRFRASTAAPLFLGEDGLTEKQQEELDKLLAKPTDKLTDIQKAKVNELLAKRDEVKLSKGAKTHIEELVDQHVYEYMPTFDSKETKKGIMMESYAIDFLNTQWFANFNKAEVSYKHGPLGGHPDIEDNDEKMIVDIKCSWSKKTFPKLPRFIDNSTYEWQGKLYLYMKSKMTGEDWRKFRLVYVLMNTPEELIPEWEQDDLHYVDHLDPKHRITYVEYELTDDDIKKIESRVKMALEYANEYFNQLTNK
jgi:hypothetical protein